MLGVNTGKIVRLSVGVETATGTNFTVYGVAYGVANREYDNQIVETTVGLAQVLCINARKIIRLLVGVETATGANFTVYGVAYGVANSKSYHQIMIATVGVAQVLCVHSRHVERLSVSVERGTRAHVAVHCVAKRVVHSKANNKVMVAAVGISQMLGVYAGLIIAHTVGVETHSGTHIAVDGVAQGVVHGKHYHKIVIAAVGISQMLGVYAGLIIAHTVGVETHSGTHIAVNGVAQSVVHT